jgi:Cu(I)/Ag(I) efflux system membrane protein CusA/SilA
MMTVVAIMAGLLPIMWSSGTGSEIMQRIAVPMIGGMISSTLLTLIVIPAIFALVKGFRLPKSDRPAEPTFDLTSHREIQTGQARTRSVPDQDLAYFESRGL